MRLQPVIDIAELCFRHGIRYAVICPGSRSAPITLGFARHTGIQTFIIGDERAAAFIAVGIAQQQSKPVALICTSGSAAYNFAPAVAEAHYQNIPLVVFTADRPTEWIGQRDGQTIQQQHIFGRHTKSFFQLPEDIEHPDSKWSFLRMINEALISVQESPRGPVHVNVPLREPLYPAPNESLQFSADLPFVDRIQSTSAHTDLPAIENLFRHIGSETRVLIIAGQGQVDADLAAELSRWTQRWCVPIVGDIHSNIHNLDNAIVRADTFLMGASPVLLEELRPEILITFGKSTLSKHLKLFLRSKKARVHWHIEERANELVDPFQSMTCHVSMGALDFFRVANRQSSSTRGSDYLKRWRDLEVKTKTSIDAFFQKDGRSEFGWVHASLASLPEGIHLHLANSLTVRYANWIGLQAHQHIHVYCNRGTSGIDGCSSTAVGHALASGELTFLITGDMAFFYDRNAFWHQYPLPNLRILLLNNHGGAIFGVIDGPQSLPESAEYFVTRQTSSARAMAQEFNLEYESIALALSAEEMKKKLSSFFAPSDKARLLEVKSSASIAKEVFLAFKEQIKTAI